MTSTSSPMLKKNPEAMNIKIKKYIRNRKYDIENIQ